MLVKLSQRRAILETTILLAALPLLSRAVAAAPLRVVTSHLPPLVNEPGGQSPGALHEIVLELCKRVNVTPSVAFVPWKRAVFLTESGAGTTIFPLTRTPEREHKFRWLVSLYEEDYVFLAPRGRAFDVSQPANMKAMRIALIRGSSLKAVLVQMGYKHIVDARSVDEVHRFLVAGIADAAYGERSIVRTLLRTRSAEADFDYSAPISRTAAWLAGSRDVAEIQAARFQRAMQDMKADGSYFAILKRYQLG